MRLHGNMDTKITPAEFCIWLDGFIVAIDKTTPSYEQWAQLINKLKQVNTQQIVPSIFFDNPIRRNPHSPYGDYVLTSKYKFTSPTGNIK